MSLKIWLPLDGSLENKGLSDFSISSNGMTFSDSGKIGKGALFSNSTHFIKINECISELNSYEKYSISLWFYLNDFSTDHSATLLSSGNWNTEGYNTVLALSGKTSTGYSKILIPNSVYWDRGIEYTIDLNKWYHLSITYNGTTTKLYINGQYISSTEYGGLSLSEVDYLYIGASTYYDSFNFKGLINDVRVYDHCLSTKEVKEISKALIAYYPLDKPYEEFSLINIIPDCSGYNNNLTVTDEIAPAYSEEHEILSGSYKFDGSVSRAYRELNISDYVFTVSAWFKIVLYGDLMYLISLNNSGGYANQHLAVILRIETDQQICVIAGGGNVAYAKYPFNLDEWYNVVFTCDGTTEKLYLNGEKIIEESYVSTVTGSNFTLGARSTSTSGSGVSADYFFNGYMNDVRLYRTALSEEDVKLLYQSRFSVDKNGNLFCHEYEEQLENLCFPLENALLDKRMENGLSVYTQSNCQCTLTDDGLRIYRPANINPTDNGNTMWGGLRLRQYDIYGENLLEKYHTYIILFDIKGQSSDKAKFTWTNNMSWDGGGLSPTPSNRYYKGIPANFQGEQLCYYKWTIEDDVYKVCTSSYSSFVAGETYLSYKELAFRFDYTDTGALGTDLYLSNFRMYDITAWEKQGMGIDGILKAISIMEGNDKAALHFSGEMHTNQIYEV